MKRILMAVAALLVAGASAASADILVMEDGRRIRGELVSVNRGTVLFDEIRVGTTRKNRMRINKEEVSRIVLRELASDQDDDLDSADDRPFGTGRAGRDDDRDDSGLGRERFPDTDDRDGRTARNRDPRRDRRDPVRDREDDLDLDPDRDDDGPFGRRDDERAVEHPDLGNDDRPLSARDRLVTVAGRQAWTDTGIDLRVGDVIRFTAEGNVLRGPGQEDGPAGEMNSPINDRRPIPARPAGALIGRIGTSSGDVFFIGGDRGAFRVRTAGRLYLGINDHYFVDNSGSFEVRVSR
jgi:hypothetical protein